MDEDAERITLISTSRADDAAFEALRDAISALDGEGVIIGGAMVRILEQRLPGEQRLKRSTRDVDIGVHRRPHSVGVVVSKLEALGYERSLGHLFTRTSEVVGPDSPLTIDLLVPTYTSRARKNLSVGSITTIEVHGLAEALARSKPTPVELRPSNGDRWRLDVPLPDPLVALALKLFAWRERRADKDAIDVMRCVRVCLHAVDPATRDGLEDVLGRASDVVKTDFSRASADGLQAIGRYFHASPEGVEVTSTELRAMLDYVLGRD